MAPTHAQRASWLALLAGLASVQAQTSTGAFWTVTSRYQQSISTSLYTYADGDISSYTYSTTRTIKSGVTPTATPYSTTTSGSSYYYSSNDDLEVVLAYYRAGAVPEADLSSPYDYSATRTSTSSNKVYTEFRMPVTYTAPASCPTQFTVSLNETVSVPTEVRDRMTPATVVTGTLGTYLYASQTETWYLTTSAAPITTSSAFNYRYYVASCSTPYVTGSSGGNYRSGGGSNDISVCSWYSGCTSLKTWIIIIASIIPGLFLLGFLENYIWFRRLMLGKSALRFGTISWICISLWVACFTRGQSARSKDDQKLLREKWNQTSSGQAFKLWWKWGFRHSYPVPLLGQYSRNTVGIVPADQPLPQMGQTPTPVYGPGYQPQPGQPAAYYPNAAPQPGQTYYAPPPQGWSPSPEIHGQGYPVPPPGQAYIPPQNGEQLYYGDQNKDNLSVTERTVSPPLPASQAPYVDASAAPATVPSPPPNAAEAPSEPVDRPSGQGPPGHGPPR